MGRREDGILKGGHRVLIGHTALFEDFAQGVHVGLKLFQSVVEVLAELDHLLRVL